MNDKFSQFLKKQREIAGKSQKDVVEELAAAGVTLSLSSYQRFEYGDTLSYLADARLVNALARVLNIEVETILHVSGHLKNRHEIDTDSRRVRILKLVADLDPDALDAIEHLVEIFARKNEQQNAKN